MNDAAIVLEARDIARAFPGVQALAGVELTLRAGEVHALMGQNGAGKSTLIKVLTGVYAPDAGSIELLGKPVTPHSPIHAQELGISAVHQESHLLPNLSVAENICAGRYPRRPWTRGGGIDWRETERRARELLAGLGIDLDVTQLAGGLPAALQQLATVARAVATDARVLILDEPTSSLDADEVQALFALIRRLRDKGVAILFVTHFLDQVYEICDRMTVLRNGKFVGEYACAQARCARPGGRDGRSRAGGGRAIRDARVRRRPANTRPCSPRTTFRAAASSSPWTSSCAHGEVLGLAGLVRLGPHRARAAAVRARRARLGRHPHRWQAGEARRIPPMRCGSASASVPRTASTAASSPNCRCAKTSRSRCRRAWGSRSS